MSTSQSDMVAFHLFSNLSPELRIVIWRLAASDCLDTNLFAQTVFRSSDTGWGRTDRALGFELERQEQLSVPSSLLGCPLWAVNDESRKELIREFRRQVPITRPIYYISPAYSKHRPPDSTSSWNPAAVPSSFVISSTLFDFPRAIGFSASRAPPWFDAIPGRGYVDNIYMLDYWPGLSGRPRRANRGMKCGYSRTRMNRRSTLVASRYRAWSYWSDVESLQRENTDLEGKQVIISNESVSSSPGGIREHDVVAYVELDKASDTLSYLFPASWENRSGCSSQARRIYDKLAADFHMFSASNPQLRRISILH